VWLLLRDADSLGLFYLYTSPLNAPWEIPTVSSQCREISSYIRTDYTFGAYYNGIYKAVLL